jgi:hypothetical protein
MRLRRGFEFEREKGLGSARRADAARRNAEIVVSVIVPVVRFESLSKGNAMTKTASCAGSSQCLMHA